LNEKKRLRERGEKSVGVGKAQASVEFMAVAALLGLMLIAVYAISLDQQKEARTQASVSTGWSVCQKIAAETNTAIGVGEGYEHSFYLPADIDGANYSVSVVPQEQAAYVYWSGMQCKSFFITSNLVGEPQPGQNKVKNDGGVIIFS
jgi:hypothetical protein